MIMCIVADLETSRADRPVFPYWQQFISAAFSTFLPQFVGNWPKMCLYDGSRLTGLTPLGR